MHKIALAQIESLSHQQQQNVEQHFDYISSAIEKKADVVVFPELSLHGHSCGSQALELAVNDEHELIQRLARHSSGVTSLVSGIEFTNDGLYYNTVYALRDGEILAKHKKLNIASYGLLEEDKYFAHGRHHTTCHLADSRFKAGILTCADSWNPALVYTLALTGCHLLLQPISSATNAVSGEYHNPDGWQINIKHTAITWGMYVAMVNRVGAEGDLDFYGGSSVIDPYGNNLLHLGDEAELAIVEVPLDETLKARFHLPTLRDSSPAFIERLLAGRDYGSSR